MATTSSAQRRSNSARNRRASSSSSGAGTKSLIFDWKGLDRNGRKVNGQISAPSKTAVKIALRKKGVNVTAVSQKRKGGGRIKSKEISVVTRQLSTMLRAGLALINSFEIIIRGCSNSALIGVLSAIRGDLETGTSFGNSLRKFPRLFSPMYVNLVEAGEIAGILDTVLERLATHTEKIEQVKSKIRGAMMYPVVVIIIAVIVVTIIMIKVIPEFQSLFASFGAELPAPTLMVVAISNFLVDYWLFLLVGIIAFFFFSREFFHRSKRFRNSIGRFSLRAPIFGQIIRNSCVARWARTLGTMFAAGVPMVEALETVGAATGNIEYEIATDQIRKDVAHGTSLAVAMQSANVFPVIVLQMVSIGEEAGSLDTMLNKIAEIYEEEVDESVKGLSAIIEPLLIVFLGVIIGALMLALYLPIFNLGQHLS